MGSSARAGVSPLRGPVAPGSRESRDLGATDGLIGSAERRGGLCRRGPQQYRGDVISRRMRLAAAGLATSTLLALGAPVGSALADDDAAARIGDVVISEDEFVDLLQRQADYERANGPSGQTPIELSEGMLNGDAARGYLRNLIILAAVDEFVASPLYVAPLADASPAGTDAAAIGDAPINAVYKRLVDAEALVVASETPDAAVLADVYDEHPARTGIVCVAPAAQTAAGADEAGGDDAAVPDDTEQPTDDTVCVVLAQAGARGIDAAQFEQLRSGRPGDSVAGGGPLAADEQWAILPSTEAAEAFTATIAQFDVDGSASMLFLFGSLAATDVEVGDRWGTWDPLSFSVVP